MISTGFISMSLDIVGMKESVRGRVKKTFWKKKGVPFWRSLTMEGLRCGNLSLEVLLEVKKARLGPQSLIGAESEFYKVLWTDRIELHDLKRLARKLEMGGKEDAAVAMLKEFRKAYENDRSHENYEIDLVLVEMLIYRGDYKVARDLCIKVRKLFEEEFASPFPPEETVHITRPTNVKIEFYQAVTSALLGETDKAKVHWEEFMKMTREGYGAVGPTVWEDGPPNEPIMDGNVHNHILSFEQFEDHILVLKEEIRLARI